MFSKTTIATLYLRYFGFSKIPLLFFVRPSVEELSTEHIIIKIPLKRRTKNHLKSMYFGALTIGADCAAGLIAMRAIQKSDEKISLVFKDMKANFLKRAEGDVFFHCVQGSEIKQLVAQAIKSHERVQMSIHVRAFVPKISNDTVAEFDLTLSLKKKIILCKANGLLRSRKQKKEGKKQLGLLKKTTKQHKI
ncbi:MAG: DUF4442 domain-containing protein [Actinobacteria bacterium]|nr:DUF4442 domain-containing protein [Actinomycetota bacterium]